jgi:hypothetical protein
MAVRRLLPGPVSKQLKNFAILATGYAQYDSMKRLSCIDRNGDPIPWYTYPAIEYLMNLDFSDRTVFEYGSGNSSLWWSKRCASIVSVEDNAEWFERIRSRAPSNMTYHFVTDRHTYVSRPEMQKADVAIIDGEHRAACASYFISGHREGRTTASLLLFDNSDWFPKAVRRLRENLDWLQVDFSGFGPINNYTSTTTLFFSRNFQQRYKSHPRSQGAIDAIATVEDS